MDERERRRAYRHNAVLIDSDRVLTPQFDDAIVYLTGAQLELLRNVSQYLNRRETYRAEKHPGYYLMPDDADYDDILAIVADMEESLMGNPNTIWGYVAPWSEWIVEESVGDAYTDAETTSVPEGYVRVLEHWTGRHTHGSTRQITLQVVASVGAPILYTVPALPSNEYAYEATHITLAEDDMVRWRVTNLASTKSAIFIVHGYVMKLTG